MIKWKVCWGDEAGADVGEVYDGCGGGDTGTVVLVFLTRRGTEFVSRSNTEFGEKRGE